MYGLLQAEGASEEDSSEDDGGIVGSHRRGHPADYPSGLPRLLHRRRLWFRVNGICSSWRDSQLAPAVAEGCAQMGLLAMN